MMDYIEWKDWQARSFGQVDAESRLVFAVELARAGFRGPRGLKIGELGFGNGSFAGYVREEGGHWVGTELLRDLVVRARDAGFEVLSPECGFSAHAAAAGSFDLIVAFDVIEHLDHEQIRSCLRDLRGALKADGRILLRLPAGESPFAGVVYFNDVTHRSLLGPAALAQIAATAGLSVLHVHSPAFPLRGLGLRTFVRRLAVLTLRWPLYWVIRNVFLGSPAAIVSPNMVVVLGVSGKGNSGEGA